MWVLVQDVLLVQGYKQAETAWAGQLCFLFTLVLHYWELNVGH